MNESRVDGYWLPVMGCWLRVTGFLCLFSSFWFPVSGFQFPVSKFAFWPRVCRIFLYIANLPLPIAHRPRFWVLPTAYYLLLTISCVLLLNSPAHARQAETGREIMEEAFKRHDLFPYVFEEQTMILMDSAARRDVRRVRRFSRVEKDGTVKYLMVFDNPPEVRGVGMLAIFKKSGQGEKGIYLPAFGKELKTSDVGKGNGYFFGADFAVVDLAADVLSDFQYTRTTDQKLGKAVCFVVEARPRDERVERTTGYGLRRRFIRQDNFFIIRTDYFDRRGRFFKRQTGHDLKNVSGDMWRANMLLMENAKKRHKTLIKINRRVFSHDYVPIEMFTPAWLFENRRIQGSERRLLQDASESTEKSVTGNTITRNEGRGNEFNP